MRGPPWSASRAVAALRGRWPARALWLFVGPSGAGGRSAARAFAAELFAADATPEEAVRHRRLAVAEQHPDLHVVERTGAAIPIEAAREIVRRASLSPAEGDRKVMVLDEFHLVSPAAAATLLKTIEEPPAPTSWCWPTRSRRTSSPSRRAAPGSTSRRCRTRPCGTRSSRGRRTRPGGRGRGRRARCPRRSSCSSDDRLAAGTAVAGSSRLDGTGHRVAALVDEIRAGIDGAAAPLAEAQAIEVAEINERIERYGQRGSGVRLEDPPPARPAPVAPTSCASASSWPTATGRARVVRRPLPPSSRASRRSSGPSKPSSATRRRSCSSSRCCSSCGSA